MCSPPPTTLTRPQDKDWLLTKIGIAALPVVRVLGEGGTAHVELVRASLPAGRTVHLARKTTKPAVAQELTQATLATGKALKQQQRQLQAKQRDAPSGGSASTSGGSSSSAAGPGSPAGRGGSAASAAGDCYDAYPFAAFDREVRAMQASQARAELGARTGAPAPPPPCRRIRGRGSLCQTMPCSVLYCSPAQHAWPRRAACATPIMHACVPWVWVAHTPSHPLPPLLVLRPSFARIQCIYLPLPRAAAPQALQATGLAIRFQAATFDHDIGRG